MRVGAFMLRNWLFSAMRHMNSCVAIVVKDLPMQAQTPIDVHFDALKDLTRLAWLLNFEAVATVPPKAGAVEYH